MKKDKNKKPVNKWKLTAIISLVINGIVALLLGIGLGQTPKTSVKVGAYNEVYDTSKIVLTTQNINQNVDYYLYFDWINQSVDGSTDIYYFPISNNVTPFALRLDGGLVPTGNEYHFASLYIKKESIDSSILFGGSVLDGTNTYVEDRWVYYINYSTEPRSMYLETYTYSSSSNPLPDYFEELCDSFRKQFNGTININSFRRLNSSWTDDSSFLKGYFSQYSVQNLEVSIDTLSNQNLKKVDFSSYDFGVYGMGGMRTGISPQISYPQNTLIKSDMKLFDTDDEGDFGLMPLLDGSFYAQEDYGAVIVGVWKRVYFPLFEQNPAVYPVYYEANFNGLKLYHNSSNLGDGSYYYYLDSINLYNVGADELGESLFNVYNIDYQSEYEWTSGIIYYTLSLSTGNLSPLVIRKLNLYPSQRNQWINFSNTFKITNHFYFGEGIIDNPSIGNDNNINGSEGAIGNVFILIKNGFESIMPLLSLMILPNISLGMLVFLPLVGTIIIVIIKLVKR